MYNILPPSFSLGFDLDAESESQSPARENRTPGFPGDRTIGDNEDELFLRVSDSDSEPELEPGRVLKRLRRGIAAEKPCADDREAEALGCGDDGDDEIEEFSSPEHLVSGSHTKKADGPASMKHHSVCSSSKVPLHGLGVLTRQPSSQPKVKSRSQQLGAQVLGGSGITSSFVEKSNHSPLRMFQLLDSDSEDDRATTSIDVSKVTSNSDASARGQQSSTSEPIKRKSGFTPRLEDLWKDFSPKSFSVPTPALDNLCQEYFESKKESCAADKRNSVGASSSTHQHSNFIDIESFEQKSDFADDRPPSHRYFLHKDIRIQNLVRNRLANFVPLGIVNGNDSQHNGMFSIDYMRQFGSGETSSNKGAVKADGKRSRGRNKSKASKPQQAIHSSEGWLDPRSSSAPPKDAGRRRVSANGGSANGGSANGGSANGGSAGHWYTSPEGRKVYMSRDGKELTGRSAYSCYRKERGGGFKKSKKKRQTTRSKR